MLESSGIFRLRKCEGLSLPCMTPEQNYGAAQIQVLEGLEPVRKRPGMYIGSTDVRGLHHLVWEIVDNSIDEAMAGHANTILVTLNDNGSVTVEDNGRGIPTDMHPTAKKSALEVVLTTLHAGGKFGGEGSGYKVSGGLHGVGSSVVNALSIDMKAEVHREGKIYVQEYKCGKPQYDVKEIGKTTKRGTIITFLPDGEIFDTLEFSLETLLTRFRQQAYLTKGITIGVMDARAVRPEGDMQYPRLYRFSFEGGIGAYVSHLNESKEKIGTPISFEKEIGRAHV